MIGFVGLSHLGLVSSIATASKGFDVVAYDSDAKLCAALTRGELPIYEPELDDLLAAARTRIAFTADAHALSKCNVIYFSLDVPTDENNQSDLTPLQTLIEQIAPFAAPHCTLVILSQVSPGFTRRFASRLRPAHPAKSWHIHYQVETLIFGRAVERALHPERTMVGCEKPDEPLPAAYAELLNAFGCPIFPMRYESAELSKISINLCLVASVSVANTLAEICEAIGADWSEIVPTLKLDKRIGPHAYLTPGLGISGGNLERDLATVKNLAHEHGTDAGIVDAWLTNSEHRRNWVLRTLLICTPRSGVSGRRADRHSSPRPGTPGRGVGGEGSGRLRIYSSSIQHTDLASEHSPLTPDPSPRSTGERGDRRTVAVWGLAYKPGTRSIKNSPSLSLLHDLKDFNVTAFDPQVAAPCEQFPHLTQADSELQACDGADVLVIMTPWPQFAAVPLEQLRQRMRGRTVIDPFAVFRSEDCARHGLVHYRLGTSSSKLETA